MGCSVTRTTVSADGETMIVHIPLTFKDRLIDVLVNGLWNALTVHQKRSETLWLVKVPLDPSIPNLRELALIRRQELDGFVEGLFGRGR
jgi:hypothetical protein